MISQNPHKSLVLPVYTTTKNNMKFNHIILILGLSITFSESRLRLYRGQNARRTNKEISPSLLKAVNEEERILDQSSQVEESTRIRGSRTRTKTSTSSSSIDHLDGISGCTEESNTAIETKESTKTTSKSSKYGDADADEAFPQVSDCFGGQNGAPGVPVLPSVFPSVFSSVSSSPSISVAPSISDSPSVSSVPSISYSPSISVAPAPEVHIHMQNTSYSNDYNSTNCTDPNHAFTEDCND